MACDLDLPPGNTRLHVSCLGADRREERKNAQRIKCRAVSADSLESRVEIGVSLGLESNHKVSQWNTEEPSGTLREFLQAS